MSDQQRHNWSPGLQLYLTPEEIDERLADLFKSPSEPNQHIQQSSKRAHQPSNPELDGSDENDESDENDQNDGSQDTSNAEPAAKRRKHAHADGNDSDAEIGKGKGKEKEDNISYGYSGQGQHDVGQGTSFSTYTGYPPAQDESHGYNVLDSLDNTELDPEVLDDMLVGSTGASNPIATGSLDNTELDPEVLDLMLGGSTGASNPIATGHISAQAAGYSHHGPAADIGTSFQTSTSYTTTHNQSGSDPLPAADQAASYQADTGNASTQAHIDGSVGQDTSTGESVHPGSMGHICGLELEDYRGRRQERCGMAFPTRNALASHRGHKHKIWYRTCQKCNVHFPYFNRNRFNDHCQKCKQD
ncbi:hypothetical protein CONLIGDRAFT_672210 [Coniochaeta ligniaria NRRL 30616]|uniref:Uncharacterized protein n=1 Tax=Coniochaeta ligniaria NRRL 30616 TaxID=1408157 RepID=A0A1J7IGX4_9PEZI|nr:hypothetical protein CONLIGDRAFT_672210 [Coniochaeta ligniaria NRRL 30616]